MTIDRSALPPNARRWLDHSVPADAPVPNQIRNTQEGEMDVRGKWTPFTAKTVYQVHPFAFIWKARFPMLPGVWIVAEDGHDSEQGWGEAKLWDLVPMGGRKTPEVFAMQRVRSLAELPWTPQFALAIPNLEWADIGDTAFEVRTVARTRELAVCFELDGNGDVIRASSKRYYDVPDGFVQAPWHYEFSDHRDYDGIRIPASAVATYEKSEEPWTYWRGSITSVASDP